MKRIALLLLSLLLLVGCVGAGAQAAGLSPLQAPSDPPASTPEPQHDGPFLSYHFYEQPNWESITSGTLFSCDLDQDGQEEPVTFQLRPNDEWATAITWNGKTTVIDVGDELISAEVLDLDPVSPWYNLLVTVDYGSDSYVTVELHPEDGQLILGKTKDISATFNVGDHVGSSIAFADSLNRHDKACVLRMCSLESFNLLIGEVHNSFSNPDFNFAIEALCVRKSAHRNHHGKCQDKRKELFHREFLLLIFQPITGRRQRRPVRLDYIIYLPKCQNKP